MELRTLNFLLYLVAGGPIWAKGRDIWDYDPGVRWIAEHFIISDDPPKPIMPKGGDAMT